MSKNIEEIVESAGKSIDKNYSTHLWAMGDNEEVIDCLKDNVIRDFKQAITDKKLCVPLSEEKVKDIVFKVRWKSGDVLGKYLHDISTEVYQAQFGGNK